MYQVSGSIVPTRHLFIYTDITDSGQICFGRVDDTLAKIIIRSIIELFGTHSTISWFSLRSEVARIRLEYMRTELRRFYGAVHAHVIFYCTQTN